MRIVWWFLAVTCACTTVVVAQNPTFRSAVDAVTVPVSVRDGRRPVTGLSADDFRITDNGVVQSPRQVDIEAVPVDVTLVIDTSDSTQWAVETFKRDTQRIAAMLRPADRIRLVAINTFAHELMPMQPAGGTLTFDSAPSGGLSAVYDALAAALMTPLDPDRRHLVLAMTDGIDTYSAISPATLRRVATRSDAVLHVVQAGSKYIGAPVYMPMDSRYALIPYNQRQFQRAAWGPFDPAMRAAYVDLDEKLLRDITARTGGAFHGPSLFGMGTVSAFKEVYDEFRHSYLLRFTPEGVERSGWHDLTVSVPGMPKVTIRARSGYSW
jgi:VWFA-related protein